VALAVWSLLLLLLVGCTGGGRSPRGWEQPAPSPPDFFRFNKGDPSARPIVHDIRISETGNQNGWHIVPGESFQVCLWAEGAEEVTFYGYFPDSEELDPDFNGIVEHGVLKTTENGVEKWCAARGPLSGPTMAIYGVAQNAGGRTLSRVLFVAWDWGSRE